LCAGEPVNEKKSTLLIVEDDLDIADMLNAYFRVQGYEVQTVNWGEDGVRAAQSGMPDLIILDIRLPDIDGFEVARRLRTNRRTRDIPIIFLTEKRGRDDRLKGLELQADDYITKPFDIAELRLRVRNALQRASQETLINPVTGMPEGKPVDEALESSLHQPDAVLLVAQLKNLERFRDVYGFVAGDDLLRAVSLMMRDTVIQMGGEEDFFGHLTPSTFVIVTRENQVHAISERIRRQLEQSFDYFYSDQHREKGLFADHPLSIELHTLKPSALQTHLEGLKAALQQFYH